MSRSMKILLCMAAFSMIMVAFNLLFSKGTSLPLDEAIPSDDPVLKKIQEQNPGIRVEKRRRDSKFPLFWAVEPKTGRSVIVPRSYADTQDRYRIEFVSCSTANIPERVLYKNPAEPVCLELSDDSYNYDAVFFRSNDRIHDLEKYYRPTAGDTYFNSLHGSYGEGEVLDPKLSHPEAFRYSFAMYEIRRQEGGGWQTLALLCYKMKNRPGK